MDRDHCFTLCLLVIVFLAVFAAGSVNARSVTATLGDTVTLRGSAPGMDEMYLFITGPNLPPGGGKMENPGTPVVNGIAGSFTRTTVSGDTWEYKWVTRTAGKMLDAGTYTVYASAWPTDRMSLKAGDYQAITVTLTSPSLSGVSATGSGVLVVISDPPGAGIIVDGIYQGITPLEMTGVDTGRHEVEVTFPGYASQAKSVEVEAGNRTVLNLVLMPVKPATPSGTPQSLETQATTLETPPPLTAEQRDSPSPTRQPLPPAITVSALSLAVLFSLSHCGRKWR